MAKVHTFYSDKEITREAARNKRITTENVEKTFGRPIFVYGTLMRGFGNYNRLLRGRHEKILDAKLYGHSICPAGHGAFPFMAPIKGGTPVIGELVYLPEKKYFEILEQLDWLEGAGSGFYNRVKVRVKTEEGDKIAWAYTCSSSFDPAKRIKSGSWRQYTMEARK